tara:strand:+ start:17644 stop:18093 length:450 start_codon:yes stop_codon:yes gene_type:complete
MIKNDIDKIHLVSEALAGRNSNGLPKFNKSKYRLLKRLSELVQYESGFKVTRDYLCDHLQVDSRNLHVTLKPLIESQLIEFDTARTDEKLKKGEVKIVINPNYCWSFSNRVTREKAVEDWYFLRDLSETSKTDITLSPAFKETLALFEK